LRRARKRDEKDERVFPPLLVDVVNVKEALLRGVEARFPSSRQRLRHTVAFLDFSGFFVEGFRLTVVCGCAV
jgi:hypothetical protein